MSHRTKTSLFSVASSEKHQYSPRFAVSFDFTLKFHVQNIHVVSNICQNANEVVKYSSPNWIASPCVPSTLSLRKLKISFRNEKKCCNVFPVPSHFSKIMARRLFSRPAARKSSIGDVGLCRVVSHFKNLMKTSLIYSVLYSNLGGLGAWFGGLSPAVATDCCSPSTSAKSSTNFLCPWGLFFLLILLTMPGIA